MTGTPKGRLEKVQLRQCWMREDTEFTPWLAHEDHISILGETIGIELEVQTKEAEVGPFRADILCRDTNTGQMVLIENQLERTDHGHLGQLLTYAAGLDAVTIIWIAENFTEEHRAALDWLNRVTDEEIQFFGLEIELWRIGDSEVAPKFSMIARPNDWSKTVKEATHRRRELTENQKIQLQYWGEFAKYLATTGGSFKPRKPVPYNWMSYGIGRSGIVMILFANIWEGRVGVKFEVDTHAHPTLLETLREEKEEIDKELGFHPEWNDNSGNRYQNIMISRKASTKRQDKWPELFEWVHARMVDIDRVFRRRIQSL